MKIDRMVQAVILMLLLALAASCEVSQQYFKIIFPGATNNYSSTKSVKFLKSATIPANNKTDMKIPRITPDTVTLTEKSRNELQNKDEIRIKRIRQSSVN